MHGRRSERCFCRYFENITQRYFLHNKKTALHSQDHTENPRKKSAEPAAAPAAAPAAPAVKTAPAPGTAGKIALHDVPDKTAAMLMAIVASKTGKPLNQLRFISIREIKD